MSGFTVFKSTRKFKRTPRISKEAIEAADRSVQAAGMAKRSAGDVGELSPALEKSGKLNETLPTAYSNLRAVGRFTKDNAGTLLMLGVAAGAIGLYYDDLKSEEEKTEFACNLFCNPRANGTVWSSTDPYREAELKAHGLEEGPICDPTEVTGVTCEEYCSTSCEQGLNYGGPIAKFLGNFLPEGLLDGMSQFGDILQYLLLVCCCMCIFGFGYKMFTMVGDTTNSVAKSNS